MYGGAVCTGDLGMVHNRAPVCEAVSAMQVAWGGRGVWGGVLDLIYSFVGTGVDAGMSTACPAIPVFGVVSTMPYVWWMQL